MFSTNLVDAIVSVALLRGVLGVFATFAVAHDPHWLPPLPVGGLRAGLVVDGHVAVLCKRSETIVTGTQGLRCSTVGFLVF